MNLEQVRMYLASETVTPEQADHYINAITKIENNRIIQLLEDNNSCNGGISTGTCFCAAIGFLEGEK